MDNLEQCYNRGCGQKFDPQNNKEDACRHHPGVPFFHDAYKGWSCCNKKCTDFTEFLNIKGCTVSVHSNVKPPEPEKPKVEEVVEAQPVEVKPVISRLERPPVDTPMITLQPEIAQSLKSEISRIEQVHKLSNVDKNEIAIGTNCKNGGCTSSYEGPNSNSLTCLHHPGVPIFHEGLKFWSCCQRKTTDFSSFLSQEGCKEGKHVWKKENDSLTKVECRWDYHQTGPFVVVSIYAKNYSPSKSAIKMNPIRLYVNLVFPHQNDAIFELDVELKGIIDPLASEVTMYGTKVEIKLKKAEAGHWPRLDERMIKKTEIPKPVESTEVQKVIPSLDAVDLSDL